MSVVSRFGPYELVRRLGIGGMAETYLAIRRGPADFVQHVCVKRILSAYESDPEFVRQFLEEARLAATLRHANIAQVVDFGEVDGSHYLALELVDGMDLRALLAKLRERGARLEPQLVTLIALDLASALDFAHTPAGGRLAIVHRDVSPSNVLVSRSGDVYLTDFGIARVLGEKRRTESGVVRGKVPYMAPEYALENTFDARTDLFALGVVLYEALAGQRPFDGVTDLDTLQRIKEGRCAPLASLAPDAPSELVEVVGRLIRPDPAHRYATAVQLIEALVPVSPSATAKRELAELVRSLSESLSASLRISATNRTAPLPASPPPSYPPVAGAAPDAATRTSDAEGAAKPSRPSQPEPGWSSTDPSRVSQHDRVPAHSATAVLAPAIPATSPSLEVPSATAVESDTSAPASNAVSPGMPVVDMSGPRPDSTPSSMAAPPPPRRDRVVLAAVVLVGLLAFVAATVGTYALVVAWQTGAF